MGHPSAQGRKRLNARAGALASSGGNSEVRANVAGEDFAPTAGQVPEGRSPKKGYIGTTSTRTHSGGSGGTGGSGGSAGFGGSWP